MTSCCNRRPRAPLHSLVKCPVHLADSAAELAAAPTAAVPHIRAGQPDYAGLLIDGRAGTRSQQGRSLGCERCAAKKRRCRQVQTRSCVAWSQFSHCQLMIQPSAMPTVRLTYAQCGERRLRSDFRRAGIGLHSKQRGAVLGATRRTGYARRRPPTRSFGHRASCAGAASGHAAAAPPMSVMNSRRFIGSLRRRAAGTFQVSSARAPWLKSRLGRRSELEPVNLSFTLRPRTTCATDLGMGQSERLGPGEPPLPMRSPHSGEGLGRATSLLLSGRPWIWPDQQLRLRRLNSIPRRCCPDQTTNAWRSGLKRERWSRST